MQNYRSSQSGREIKSAHGRQQNKPSALPQYNQVRNTPVSVKFERIRPIKPTAPEMHRPTKKAVAAKRQASRTALRDFIFGFIVGLIIFGTASAIICSSLLELLT